MLSTQATDLKITTDLLAQAHREFGTVWQAWHQQHVKALERGVQDGMSVTAAREYADGQVVDLRCAMEDMKAEVAARTAERDYWALVITHGGV